MSRKLSEEHKKKMELARKKPKLTLSCKFCHKEFVVPYGQRDRMYCGRSCQSKSVSRTDIRKTSLCIICKKEFLHYGERILCGRKCQAQYMSDARVGINNPAYKGKKETALCKQCSKSFEYSRVGLHADQARSFCSLECSHGLYKGKRSDSSPTAYDHHYPSKFRNLKTHIKERDGFRCLLCSKSDKLHVHHIDYNKENNDSENLITLCQTCHVLTNFNRSFWENVFSSLLSGSKIVRKGWGFESHITNTDKYCLKYLVFFKQKEFSFHSHSLKKELWHCLMGKFECVLQNGEERQYFIFKKGDKIEIEPNVIHQLRALENSILVEVSTTDYPEDSYRLLKGD